MPQGCGCGSGGGGTCQDVEACVARMTEASSCITVTGGPATDRSLMLQIDPQASNLARCGPDGLIVDGDITPTFCAPPDLVAPYWIAEGTGPYAPWGSPAYLDIVAAHRIDGIFVRTWAAPDGPFVWGIGADNSSADYYLDHDYNDRQDAQPTAPSGNHGDIDSVTWRNATSPAGNGTAFMPNNEGRQVTDPDSVDGNGGWWGWGARSFSPMLLQEALDRIGCRYRVFCELDQTNFHTVADQATMFGEQISAQARNAGVVGVVTWRGLGSAQTIGAFGIQTGATIDDEYTGDGSDLVAAGVTYAIANPEEVTPAVMDSLYANPELQVIARLSTSRHYKTEAAITDGAEGILCDTPVYARAFDGDAAEEYFKRPRMLYDHNRHLATSTERGDVDNGYPFEGLPGRVLYVPGPTTSQEARQRELLLGDLEIEDPTNFDLSWVQTFSTDDLVATNDQFCGMFFGMSRDSTTWPARAEGDDLAAINGYLVAVKISTGSQQGNLVVSKWTAGVGTELHDGTSIGADTVHRCGLSVAPSQFTFGVYTDDWSATQQQVTITDPDFRGGYVWAVAITSAAQNSPLATRFYNVQNSAPLAP